MPEGVVLFHEDFSGLAVGPLPTDCTAIGEYHYLPPDGDMGRWYEPMRGCWPQTSPYLVFEDDGRHRLLQTLGPDCQVPRILVTGQDEWADYTVTVRLQPLKGDGQAGVALRYETSRHHYRLCLDAGQRVRLYRVDNDRCDVLSEREVFYTCDRAFLLDARLEGDLIEARLDDQLLFRVRDGRYASGRVALVATAAVIYDEVTVRATEPAHAAFVQTRDRTQRQLDELRRRQPKPVLWRRIDTKGFGTGRQVRFGHLRSPDRLDIVLAQNVKLVPRSDALTTVRCLTAVDLDGNVLWQFGEPADDPDAALVTCDLAVQVYDIDGDGLDEVLCLKNFKLYVLDGPTGQVRCVHPLPLNPPAENRFGRLVGDAIIIANLRGLDRPRDLLIKNRYRTLWAYDDQFNLLWRRDFPHWFGHFAQPYDFDGDGRDEVFIGYTLLGPDGEVRWSHDWPDHTDEIAIGPFDPDRPGVQIAVVAGESGLGLFAPDPAVLARRHVGHAQRLTAARLRDDLPGLQFYVVTYWGHAGIVSLHDCRGNRLLHFEPTALGTVLNPVNWTGGGTELALLSGSCRHGGMVDGLGQRVVLFPDDGHPELCAEAIDLTGDVRDEVVLWDRDRIWIYTQDRPFAGDRIYHPIRYPHHNASNYRAEISLPRWSPTPAPPT